MCSNFKQKIFSAPVWFFLLLLLIFFITYKFKFYMSFSSAVYEFLKYAASTIIGGLITYFTQIMLENRKDMAKALNASVVIIRSLLCQYNQMVNLLKELEIRQELLKKTLGNENFDSITHADLICISQDFREGIYKIDLSQLYSLPRPKDNFAAFEEALLKVVLRDRGYSKLIDSILSINEAKREILKDARNIPEFIDFLDRNIPNRIEAIKENMKKNKNTLQELQKTLKNIFGKKFKEMQYGETYLL